MNWFNKLERKFGKYAVKNLMNYIIGLYALGFIINVFYPKVYTEFFSLNAEAILKHGQIWRIITFIIQPTTTSPIFLFFSLYLYYMIGTVLERVWGSFKFNVYFFMGVLFHVVAAIIIYLVFDITLQLNTYYLNMALFMAFATIQPDLQLLMFFIIPIKIKWLAYIDGIYFAATIVFGYLSPFLSDNMWLGLATLGVLPAYKSVYYAYVFATAALVSMLNFLIFFFMTQMGKKTKGQRAFRQAMNSSARENKSRDYHYQSSAREGEGLRQGRTFSKITKHKCAVCGKTEHDGEDLEFRFCSKCHGAYEYCSEHLYTHKHVTKESNGQTKDNVTNFSDHI